MKRAIYIFLLATVCIFTLFIGNRVKPADIMECRNLATAREMVVYGNYLNPTLNGEARLEKPPLPTWGAAVVEMIFPGNIVWQRNLTGLMGMLWVIFTFLTAIELGAKQRQAFWIGLIMATCYSVMFMSRNATWDIWCHTMMAVAIFYYVKGIRSQSLSIGSFIMAGCFMGLSFLSKGPVSFYTLLLPFLISFHIAFKPSMRDKWVSVCMMILSALIIGGWWYLYLKISDPHAISCVIQKETSAWSNHSVRPWYYYHLFFTESGLWCLYWIAALACTTVYSWYKKEKLLVMGVLWSVVALVLLSIPPEKKTRYLLPMMMPCALSVGCWFYLLYTLLKSDFTTVKGLTAFKVISAAISGIITGIGIAIFFKPIGMLLNPGIVVLSVISILIGASGIYIIFFKPNERNLSFSPIKIRMLIFIFIVELCCISLLGIGSIGKIMTNNEMSNISEFREIEQLKEYNIYSPVTEELRPEIMYAAGKRIILMDFNSADTINIEKPYILILSKPMEEYPQLTGCKVTKLKRFDANWKKRDSNSYNHNLVKDIYLVTPLPQAK